MPETKPSPAAPAVTLGGEPAETVSAGEAPSRPGPEMVEADLLVEDVSIDGMCGVY